MKRLFGMFAAVSLLLAVAGCSSAYNLAQKLLGAWSSVPERLIDTDASSATIIETYAFTPLDSVKDGGLIQLTSLISVTGAVQGTPGISTPVSLTASGYATVCGKWTATSSEALEISLDMSTLVVNVDPEAVLISTNISDDVDNALTEQLRPQFAKSVRNQLLKAATERYSGVMKLNDVRIIDDTTLKFKLNKNPYTLTRQPE